MKGRVDGEETRKRILEKAALLFVQKGYGAVSMNEVCETAGVSKGSLYHHFPSKDELFLQVVEEDTERWQRDWEHKRSKLPSLEDQLYALAEHYADDFQNPLVKVAEEFTRSRIIDDALFQRMLQVSDTSSQACRELLREGMDKGVLARADLEEMVIIVSSMFEGLGKIYYSIDRQQEPDRVTRFYKQAVGVLLNGIRKKHS